MYVLGLLGWLVAVIILMSVSCVYSLNEARAHMSPITRQMHIRFLKNIFFQVSYPRK